MIKLTERATSQVKNILEKEGKQGCGLRIYIAGGGCAGLQYGMDFEKESKKDDIVTEKDGLKIFVDPESAPYLAAIEIDYVESLHGSGFKVNNPNAVRTCGCGQSFNTV